jgi:hypothetical protein
MRPHSDMKRAMVAFNETTGNLYPSAPGDQPFLLVRVLNDTSSTLRTVPIAYDTGTGARTFNLTVYPQEGAPGILLDWPVTQVAVGSLQSPVLPSITATLPDGTNVVIPPLLFPAQAGVDFNSGDTLVYRFTSASSNPAAIYVNLSRIAGSTQTGPFTRADTFRTVAQVLELNALQNPTGTTTATTTTTGTGTGT